MLNIQHAYDLIAKEFAVTRVFTWNWTDEFIESLQKYSMILDIGCGNGRNLNYKNQIMIGNDLSLEQLNQCSDNKCVIQCDMLKLSFKNQSFDAILLIASFHHLEDINSRHICLQSIKRILRPKGKILLSVWSINQPKKTRRVFTNYGDNIVPWRNIPRYYYIFEINELKDLLEKYFTIEKYFWDSGNEIFILIN